jgi:hypothetical protein
MTERQYLLIRCLRLEARLLGVEIAPFDPAAYDARPPFHLRQRGFVGQMHRKVMPEDIVQMRALRKQGLSYNAIAARVGFAEATARLYTRDVCIAPLVERAVGE